MQSAVLWFATDDFVDTDKERAERINENIGGAALASWLCGALRDAGLDVIAPWAEDHGWDFEVRHTDSAYLIVCTIEDDEPREACVQINQIKPRTFRAASLPKSDFVVSRIAELIEARGASVRHD